MKKALAVSTFTTNFAPIVFSGELVAKLPLVRELGFEGIDLFIKRPDEPGLFEVIEVIERTGLEVAMVAAVSAAVDEGLSLTDLEEAGREMLLSRMTEQIALAGRLGAKVPIGLLRGSALPGEPVEAALDRLAVSLRRLLTVAEDHGVSLMLEPINRYETNLINSVQDALDFLNRYDLPMELLIDTFHMNIEDVSIEVSIREAAGRIGHVHLVDSNRRSAGLGHLDFGPIMAALREVGYDAFLSSEAIPLPDPLTSARQAASYLSQLI